MNHQSQSGSFAVPPPAEHAAGLLAKLDQPTPRVVGAGSGLALLLYLAFAVHDIGATLALHDDRIRHVEMAQAKADEREKERQKTYQRQMAEFRQSQTTTAKQWQESYQAELADRQTDREIQHKTLQVLERLSTTRRR